MIKNGQTYAHIVGLISVTNIRLGIRRVRPHYAQMDGIKMKAYIYRKQRLDPIKKIEIHVKKVGCPTGGYPSLPCNCNNTIIEYREVE